MNCAHNCIKSMRLEMAAWAALDDLREVQQALDNAHAVFTMIIDKTGGGHISNDLAQLGIADLSEWSEKIDRYADQLESSLAGAVEADLPTETKPGA